MSIVKAFIEQHKRGEIKWQSLKLFTTLEDEKGNYGAPFNYNIQLADPDNILLEGLFCADVYDTGLPPLLWAPRKLHPKMEGDEVNQWYQYQLRAEREMGLKPKVDPSGFMFLCLWYLTWIDWTELPKMMERPVYDELLKPLYYAAYAALSVLDDPLDIPPDTVRIVLAAKEQ